MKKKGLSIGLIACATIMILGACGSDKQDNTENSTEIEATTVPYEHYTVVFDKNTTPEDTTDDETFNYYTTGWGAQQKSSVVEIEYSKDAYIPASEVPMPSRKDYYFAGWQTVPVVEDSDIVNGVSQHQVFFDTKLSAIGEAKTAGKSTEEVDARQLENDVMYLKDFDNLTEDGTVTLYARWVKAKEVSTEEDLRNMGKDLYGAYVLTNDITLTEDWNPIGAYFSNYEYFNDSWWTYAFRGTLDGNGHTISGLNINGAEVQTNVNADTTGAIWHKDGPSANGTAAMFGAICYATIQNLTIDGANINVAGEHAYQGDYCYAATVACFDMQSTIKNVTLNNPIVHVEYSDAEMLYGSDMFVVVAGLEAGGWTSTVTDCNVVNADIQVTTNTSKSHGGELYLGGLIGECYATMKNNIVESKLTLNHEDVTQNAGDRDLLINIGGMSAANTSSTGNTVNATMDLKAKKPVGEALINLGGYAGSQRYMSADKNIITADIKTDFTLDESKGTVNTGAVLGRMDAYYASLILMYADGVKCGATGNTADVKVNGAAVTDLIPESGMPQIDGKPVNYIATKDYTDEAGNSYKANIDEIIAEYGSYVPKSSMTNNIMYIDVE